MDCYRRQRYNQTDSRMVNLEQQIKTQLGELLFTINVLQAELEQAKTELKDKKDKKNV